MESFLKGQKIFGFVDGSTPCPPSLVRATDGTTTPSAEYEAWKVQDQNIINMIGHTLSQVAVNCAVGTWKQVYFSTLGELETQICCSQSSKHPVAEVQPSKFEEGCG